MSGLVAWSCACVLFGALAGVAAEEDVESAKAFLVCIFVAFFVALGAWVW